MVLSQLKVGKTGEITTIEGGKGLKQKLLLRGLSEGKMLRVISNYGPVTIELDGGVVAIGRGMAQKIIVGGVNYGEEIV